MKSLLLTIAVSFFLISSAPATYQDVYICNGKYSKKYHLSKDCNGLSNCSTEVEKVTLKDAQSKGRTLCKLED